MQINIDRPVLVSGCQPHDEIYLFPALEEAGYTPHCTEMLSIPAALRVPAGCDVLVSFVLDRLDAAMLETLVQQGIRLLAQRAAGVDNIDLDAAHKLELSVSHVPAYSPESVAEHTVALLLAIARHLPLAISQVRGGNFSLQGLLGFKLHGKTVGIIGMGRIGQAFARIMLGFGCRVLGYSRHPYQIAGVENVSLDALWRESDIVSLHCPLTSATQHLVDSDVLGQMRPGAVLINTARGGVVDTLAVLEALDSGRLSAYGADVYENEACVFFRDCSACGYDDPLLSRLLVHPRVLITPHQAFFTHEALREIARSVVASVDAHAHGVFTKDFLAGGLE